MATLCLLMFTDASPEEHVRLSGPTTWHTVAGMGLLLAPSPLATAIHVPGLSGGFTSVAHIPGPDHLVAALQKAKGGVIREWKRIRGAKRKERAAEFMLQACGEGKFLFLSHSTRSDLVRLVAERYLSHYCGRFARRATCGFVFAPNPQHPGFKLSEDRALSLGWIAHCFSVFLFKARESYRVGYVDAIYVHDALPHGQPEHAEILRSMVEARDPGHVRLLVGARRKFAPADNLAGIARACVDQGSLQVWKWIQKRGGRPGTLYMTVDEADGKFTRFI